MPFIDSCRTFSDTKIDRFLSINEEFSGETQENDLIVGEKKLIKLTIENGEEVQYRDIVVLGHLTIQSSDAENEAVKGKIVARDIFIAGGECSGKNIHLENRHTHQLSAHKFYRSLGKVLLERMNALKEREENLKLESA